MLATASQSRPPYCTTSSGTRGTHGASALGLIRVHALRRLLHFNLTNGAVSLIGNLSLMKLLVGWFGLPLLAANLCAIAACSTVNFVIAECFVFAAKPQMNDGGLFI